MTRFPVTSVEERRLYSPIGVRLVDDMTEGAPFGRIRSLLDVKDEQGVWQPTDVEAVITPGGIVAYPGLGFRVDAPAGSKTEYRYRVSAQFYLADYIHRPLPEPLPRPFPEGIEFLAYAYNHATPLPDAHVTKETVDLILVPAPNYPFLSHVPVLRGKVRNGTGPVAGALVSDQVLSTVLTDERGEFALPLRNPKPKMKIDATHPETGQIKTEEIEFPCDLENSLQIVFS